MERGINKRRKQILTAADRFPATAQIAKESKAPDGELSATRRTRERKRSAEGCPSSRVSDCKKQKM